MNNISNLLLEKYKNIYATISYKYKKELQEFLIHNYSNMKVKEENDKIILEDSINNINYIIKKLEDDTYDYKMHIYFKYLAVDIMLSDAKINYKNICVATIIDNLIKLAQIYEDKLYICKLTSTLMEINVYGKEVINMLENIKCKTYLDFELLLSKAKQEKEFEIYHMDNNEDFYAIDSIIPNNEYYGDIERKEVPYDKDKSLYQLYREYVLGFKNDKSKIKEKSI